MARNLKRITRLIKRNNDLFQALDLLATGLDLDELRKKYKDDEDAIVANLDRVADHIVRGEILREYTFIDMLLEFELVKHFFGKKFSTRKKSFNTFSEILNQLYLIKKLELIRSYKKIPKEIVSRIHALNDLRNGFAHSFIVEKKKQTYKGKDVMTPEGLDYFIEDMYSITEYFAPWLVKAWQELT
jgi:hypothetical protein